MKSFLLISLLAGASPAAEFPIGLFGVPPSADHQRLAEDGFTHILSTEGGLDAQLAHARTARKFGISTIAYLMSESLISNNPPPKDFAFWYIADEPEIYNQHPNAVDALASKIRSWDRQTPLTLVVSDGKFAEAYSSSVQSVMVDWYPVPHLPLASAGHHIALAKRTLLDKPIYAVIQAMDWRNYPQRNPAKPRIGRFPTKKEIRLMAYHAITQGADGIFFFELQIRPSPNRTLFDEPESWGAVSELASELKLLRPFFQTRAARRYQHESLSMAYFKRGNRQVYIVVNPTLVAAALPAELCTDDFSLLFSRKTSPPIAFLNCKIASLTVAVFVARSSALSPAK